MLLDWIKERYVLIFTDAPYYILKEEFKGHDQDYSKTKTYTFNTIQVFYKIEKENNK